MLPDADLKVTIVATEEKGDAEKEGDRENEGDTGEETEKIEYVASPQTVALKEGETQEIVFVMQPPESESEPAKE